MKRIKVKGLKTSKLDSLHAEHKKYNKEMRQIGCHSQQKNFDDFVAYKYGYYKPKVERFAPKEEELYQRPSQVVPSKNSGIFTECNKKDTRVYTGDLISGIATMHKSNAVPVFNKQQAEDLATMRR